MTNLLECLEEVIAKGDGYVIHTSQRAGAHSTSDWEPSALLADIRVESPLVLTDHAYTQWGILSDGTSTCSIPYGTRELSGTREIPGYGTLHVYSSTHVRKGANIDAIPSTGFRLGM